MTDKTDAGKNSAEDTVVETQATHCTPYAAAKRVNAALAEAGLTKVIPPQMMYNYTKARLNKGLKPFITFTLEEGVLITDLDRWTATYIDKQIMATYAN